MTKSQKKKNYLGYAAGYACNLKVTCLSRPILNSTLEQVPVLSLSNFSVKCLSPGSGSRPTPLNDGAVPSP